jgi:putative redox protein
MRSVVVESGASGYVQTIAIGPHRLTADESAAAGGTDAGPNPPELLLAALGACRR